MTPEHGRGGVHKPMTCELCHAERMGAEIAGVAAERDRYRTALYGLLHAFVTMPDAGLTPDDPRYRWWFDTADARKHAREVLDLG